LGAIAEGGALAFTSGAKPGRRVNAAAMKAAIAHAESAFTIMIPFSRAFWLACEEDAGRAEKVHHWY
jgi:hypothetical protein